MAIVRQYVNVRVCDACHKGLDQDSCADERVTVDWKDDSGNGGTLHFHSRCLGPRLTVSQVVTSEWKQCSYCAVYTNADGRCPRPGCTGIVG